MFSQYKNYVLSPFKYFSKGKKIPVTPIKTHRVPPAPYNARLAAFPPPPRKRYGVYQPNPDPPRPRRSGINSIRAQRSVRLHQAGLGGPRRASIRKNVSRVIPEEDDHEPPNRRLPFKVLLARGRWEGMTAKKLTRQDRIFLDQMEKLDRCRIFKDALFAERALMERAERDNVFREETVVDRLARLEREKEELARKKEHERLEQEALAKKLEQERLAEEEKKKLEHEELMRQLAVEFERVKKLDEEKLRREAEEANRKRKEEELRRCQEARHPPRTIPRKGTHPAIRTQREFDMKERSDRLRRECNRRKFEAQQQEQSTKKTWTPKGRDFTTGRRGYGLYDEPEQFPPKSNFHQSGFATGRRGYGLYDEPEQPRTNFQQPGFGFQHPPPQPNIHEPRFGSQEPPSAPQPNFQQQGFGYQQQPQSNFNQEIPQFVPQPPPAPPAPVGVPVFERFDLYDKKWEALRGGDNIPQLFFGQFPWPVLCDVSGLQDITEERLGEFFFHSARPGFEDKSRRDRVRKEFLRWHPDKFEAKMLDFIIPEHKELVKEAAGTIARFLTQEKKA